jgi:hypothetical protein
VYAYLTCRSRVAPLLIEINTRYGWVASPYPTGTCTPQETPSFARRDNVLTVEQHLTQYPLIAVKIMVFNRNDLTGDQIG